MSRRGPVGRRDPVRAQCRSAAAGGAVPAAPQDDRDGQQRRAEARGVGGDPVSRRGPVGRRDPVRAQCRSAAAGGAVPAAPQDDRDGQQRRAEA
ncbi:hypothetical protein, partial [Streptomyces sp. EN16]|uniref:hypothetical protein n=1 Tax=Streptomyces sp. EN16 TaxID=212773 RepID=UPI001C404F84